MAGDLLTNEGGPRRERDRRRNAYSRGVAVLRAFRDTAATEEMERIAAHLEAALAPADPDIRHNALLNELTGGQILTPKERFEREAESTARYFRTRRQLLEDSLSAPQVAQLLGTSRQTPHDRVRVGTLLAVRERGGLRFPHWQFDPNGQDGVLDGLPQILRALDVPPLAKVSWFVRSNPYLEGQTPIEALAAGQADRLVQIARGVGVS